MTTLDDLELLVSLTEPEKLRAAIKLEKFCSEYGNIIIPYLNTPRTKKNGPVGIAGDVYREWIQMHSDFALAWGKPTRMLWTNITTLRVPVIDEPWCVVIAKQSDLPAIKEALEAYLETNP